LSAAAPTKPALGWGIGKRFFEVGGKNREGGSFAL
jgi:hypothetical protein